MKMSFISASFRARSFALLWSSCKRSTVSSSAISPAAARIPVCLIIPPNIFLLRLASSIKAFLPRSMAPAGQHRPFERQNVTESTGAAISLTGVDEATDALKILAPSICTGTSCSCAKALISVIYFIGRTLPELLLWVFSIQISPVDGVLKDCFLIKPSTLFKSITPFSPGNILGIAPATTQRPPHSLVII